MKKKTDRNEIIQEVRKNRENRLREFHGDPSELDKNGKALAKKYGLKLSKRVPLELKPTDEAA